MAKFMTILSFAFSGIPRITHNRFNRCPYCHWKLKRGHKLWHKYVQTLSGQVYVISQGYRYSNPACEGAQTTYRSSEAELLSAPECGYGLDVMVEVGYQRFWQQRTVAESHAALRPQVLLSERQILNLPANFLALLRAGQGARIAGLKAHWQELGGLVLALDGMHPVIRSAEVAELSHAVREVEVEESVLDYILAIVTATHEADAVQVGVSPRGSLALHTTHPCR